VVPFRCLRACRCLGCRMPLRTPHPHQLLLSLVVDYSPLVLLCRCRMRIHCSASRMWMPWAPNVPTISPLRVVLLTPHHASMSTQFGSHTSMSSHLDKNDLLHHFFPLSLPHPQLSAHSINPLTPCWAGRLLSLPSCSVLHCCGPVGIDFPFIVSTPLSSVRSSSPSSASGGCSGL
jgi:hypothetical protein